MSSKKPPDRPSPSKSRKKSPAKPETSPASASRRSARKAASDWKGKADAVMSSARGKNRSSAKKRAEDIDSSDNELNANELHTSEIEEMKSAGPRGRKQRATPASARKSPGRQSSPKKEETKASPAKSKSKPVSPAKSPGKASGEFYGFKADDIDGKSISMSKYQGKLLLIVNVASR